MDKFVVKTPSASSQEKKRSHLPVNTSVVDHLRKFVVDKHLEAESHKRNGEKNARGGGGRGGSNKC